MVIPKLVIIIALLLVLFFFIYESEGASYSSASQNVGHGDDNNPSNSHQKVNLSVYYDSFCQSCAKFIIQDLRNIFDSNLISIVKLQLVPWASAYLINNSISCQNGPEECDLNSLESCAFTIWHKVDIQYQLINCFEFLAFEGTIIQWKECLNQLGLPKEPIQNCFSMGNGTQLVVNSDSKSLYLLTMNAELGKSYINQTAQLNPPPSFVPWVVVNNQPLGKDYENFAGYVCKAYRGAAVPGVCNPPLK